MTSRQVKLIGHDCGFELVGVTSATPSSDASRFFEWVERGYAGAMGYLTDHRSALRADPRELLPEARSMICVGRLYNGPQPYSTEFSEPTLGWIARFAWGEDYHVTLRSGLEQMAARLGAGHSYRVCVDTAPLLERSYARLAGLGWIGKNQCVINQHAGSWFFLGELLTSFKITPDLPAAERCGSCTRCIEACPTAALIPVPGLDPTGPAGWQLDASRCVSYWTIEFRGPFPREVQPGLGRHVFGCDICQDVCPWNNRSAITLDPAFSKAETNPPLAQLAALSPADFQKLFRHTPVSRARYTGFLRNVAIAMGNSSDPNFVPALESLVRSEHELIRDAARSALTRLGVTTGAS